MKTQTIRKLSFWNLEIIFPTTLSIVLSVFLYRSTKSDFTPALALAIPFFAIGTVGLIFIICQLLTKIVVDHIGISQVFLGEVRRIQFEEIETFEVYKVGRFGATKLNKHDLYSVDVEVKSARIILISKTSGKKPNPWWKRDRNTISIPFRHDIFKLIENNMKETAANKRETQY